MATKRMIAAVSVPCAVFAVVLAAARGHEAPQADVIQLPTEWIPFTARHVVIHKGTQQEGMFYRRSDGSTALVLKRPVGDVITIHNQQTQTTYVRFGDAEGWVSYPLSDDAVARLKPVLAARSGRLRAAGAVAGSAVYELGRPNERVLRLAVGLNGFPIYTRMDTGDVTEYRDIVIGEPLDDLFLPPPGVEVAKKVRTDLLPNRATPKKHSRDIDR